MPAAPRRARGSPPQAPPKRKFFSSFFRCVFQSIFVRSWLDFAGQLASQNPPKSIKNRCQEAIHLGLQFLVEFWLIFGANFDSWTLKNQAPAAARARFIKKSLFAICINFSLILVPTCLYFPSKNPLKMYQNYDLDWFWLDFWLIFHRFLVWFLVGVLLVF